MTLDRNTENEIGTGPYTGPEVEGVRAIFHIEGVTDLTAQLASLKREGVTVYNIHEHRDREPCNGHCVFGVSEKGQVSK